MRDQTRLIIAVLSGAVAMAGWQAPARAQGWAAFAMNNKVYRVQVGQQAEALYDGVAAHACWSAQGKYIYFIRHDGKLWRMNNDGTEAREIGSGLVPAYNPLAAYRPDPEYVLYVEGTRFFKVDGTTGERTAIQAAAGHNWKGEIGISQDGQRLAGRGGAKGDLYRVDLTASDPQPVLYDTNCSSSISPNGQWLTANIGEHVTLGIVKWSGSSVDCEKDDTCHKILSAPAGVKWDNQRFAVNSNDWVVYRYDDDSAVGVVQVSTNQHHTVCKKGPLHPDFEAPSHPDFYVGALPGDGSDDPGPQPDQEPDGGPTTDQVVIEAEEMQLDGYRVEGELIGTMSSGRATASFPGQSALYRARVVIVKENDGRPELDVLVAGTQVASLTYDIGSASRDPETVDLGQVNIAQGDHIELSGQLQGQAAARVDKLLFERLDALPDSVGDDASVTGGSDDHQTDAGLSGDGSSSRVIDEPVIDPADPAAQGNGSPNGLDDQELTLGGGCAVAHQAPATLWLALVLGGWWLRRRRR